MWWRGSSVAQENHGTIGTGVLMSWETRNGKHYFYSAYRENGRLIKEYLGRGEAAVLAASVVADARNRQVARVLVSSQRRKLLDAAGLAWFDLDRECRSRMQQTLEVEGYHRVNHGPWRLRRAGPLLARPPHTETPEQSRLSIASNEPMVRAARFPWITLLVGEDPQLIQELERSADEVRDELAGDDHRSDVWLLAERAAVAWLAWEYADPSPSSSLTVRPAALGSRSAAWQRFERAAQDVATLRRLAPRGGHQWLKVVQVEEGSSGRTDRTPRAQRGVDPMNRVVA
jgi:hypothetical protein